MKGTCLCNISILHHIMTTIIYTFMHDLAASRDCFGSALRNIPTSLVFVVSHWQVPVVAVLGGGALRQRAPQPCCARSGWRCELPGGRRGRRGVAVGGGGGGMVGL